MSDNKNEHAVVALFDSVTDADIAIDSLKNWDNANDEIKLGSIATISKEGDKIKAHTGRKGKKGAKAGAIVGVIAGVLSGGVTLIGGALAGAVGGGVLGSFFKKGTPLSKEEIAEIGAALDEGCVAVVVACDEDEVEATSAQLAQSGGKVRNYAMPVGTMDETAAAIEAEGAAAPTDAADAPITGS
ncbi:MAG: DUF1269 domain-containing protein [Caldilinea sp.]